MRQIIVRVVDYLRRRLGVDRAISATAATQLSRLLTGPITMVLMIRYLSPEEQGFFYSFAGVVGIQVFLEAGFAQSITQFTTREFANLSFDNSGKLTGDSASLSRLRSVFQQANRYYLIMAAVLILGLAIGGFAFFSRASDSGVPWETPWIVISVCAGLGFLLTPYWAMLEGCNLVAQIATFRLFSTLGGFAVSSLSLVLGIGIYAAMLSAIAMLLMPLGYLLLCRREVIRQVLIEPGLERVSWRKEIWGFQWRIALTWVSRYFLESGIAPLAFHLSGPILAGKMGMTFQLVRTVGGIANTWTVTKIPSWGILAAQGKWQELEESWRSAARQSVTLCGMGMITLVIGIPILTHYWAHAATRFLEVGLVACFAFGWFMYSFWLISMHYTRALREEPFTFLHLGVGAVFVLACFLCKDPLGFSVIPIVFMLVHVPPAFIALSIRTALKSKMEPAL